MSATKKYRYLFDTYVIVYADDEDEARALLGEAEERVDTEDTFLAIYDAWGYEDAETGEEIRQVH